MLGTNLTAFLAGAGMFGAMVLILQYVQTPSRVGYGFGADALGAGLTLLPLTAGTLIAAVLVSTLIRRVGPKWPLTLGMVVATGTFAFLAAFHTEHWQFYVATGLLGLGLGLAMGAMPTLLNTAVAPEKTSIANSVNSTLRSVGGSIGTAVATAIITSNMIPGTPLPTVDALRGRFPCRRWDLCPRHRRGCHRPLPPPGGERPATNHRMTATAASGPTVVNASSWRTRRWPRTAAAVVVLGAVVWFAGRQLPSWSELTAAFGRVDLPLLGAAALTEVFIDQFRRLGASRSTAATVTVLSGMVSAAGLGYRLLSCWLVIPIGLVTWLVRTRIRVSPSSNWPAI